MAGLRADLRQGDCGNAELTAGPRDTEATV